MKIAIASDFDLLGSGYKNLSSKFGDGLVALGHEVKALGLHYQGQEHNHNFSIVPIENGKHLLIAIHNLLVMWKFDVLIVALDVNLQNYVLGNIQQFRNDLRYVGIMPIEADPLCTSWAMVLLQMDLPLIISKFGTEEAHKANIVTAKYLELGVDTDVWKVATPEEKSQYRKGLFGINDDTFVVLTVADNQERKNLSAGMEAFRRFSLEVPNSKYVLVTRENNPVGWSLRDLMSEFNISDKMVVVERGMSQEDLHKFYASADCFLLPSKAEGLGLPLLEAMSSKIPCVATNCTGMKELLGDGRGFLVEPEYIHRDPFGNGRRYWIDIDGVASMLHKIHKGELPDVEKAYLFVKEMTWDKSINILNEELIKLVGDGK